MASADHPSPVSSLRRSLEVSGLDLDAAEQILALTASSDGEVLFALVISQVINPGFGEIVKLFTDDAYASIKGRLSDLLKRNGPEHYVLVARGGSVDARIDDDLPPEAYLKLQGTLPAAPSGRIAYDRQTGRWVPEPPDD